MFMQPHRSYNPAIVAWDKTSIAVRFDTGDQQPKVIHLKTGDFTHEVKIQSSDADWAQRAVPYSPLND